MAQIEQSDKGTKKKGAQKKMAIHVDFTPMVDMNMLLITFFMLCTTMIKNQTLQITLPTNEKLDNQQEQSEAKESEAITILLDSERMPNGELKRDADGNVVNHIFYYTGIPDEATTELIEAPFKGDGVSVRAILQEKNKDINERIAKLNDLYIKEKITSEQFQAVAKLIKSKKDAHVLDSLVKTTDETRKINLNAAQFNAVMPIMPQTMAEAEAISSPNVIIKPTNNASYQSIIYALDEMQINNVSRYNLNTIAHVDSVLMKPYLDKYSK